MGKIKRFKGIDQYIAHATTAASAGKTKEAVRYYQEVLKIDPDHAFSLYNLGILLKDLNQLDEAAKCFQKVTTLDPTFTGAYDELGFCLETIGKPEEAVQVYQKAIGIDPHLAILHNNLGNALKKAGKPKEAIPCYEIAIALSPNYADAYNNLGTTYHLLKKEGLAKENLEKAISINPQSPYFYYNLGIVFGEDKKLDKAIKNYKKTITLEPKFLRAHSNLYAATRQICDWPEIPKLEAEIEQIGQEDPFISISHEENPAKNLWMARLWSRDIERRAGNQVYPHDFKARNTTKKIRLGYLSNDFRNHPIGQMVASMFKYHDRTRFETHAYSYGKNDKSVYLKTVSNNADAFIDISAMTYKESAQKIYEAQVDILIDITGYTLGNKLEICALRPTPIQVSWLGFPGTSGAAFFDYAVVDKTIVQPGDEAFYSEKLAYLPRCYQVNNNSIQISKKSYTRKDFRLPKDSFIFTSFNQTHKMEPVMWTVWMNILKRVPDSVLWLWHQDSFSPKNLKKEAEKAGINPSRIIFSKKLPKEEHLKRMALADLGLDTRIYGGHTTTSDMLWAGIPVITKTGNHFASRVCTSILTEAKLPELITHSLDEYEDKAVYLAQNPKALIQIRNKITHEHLQKNLYDTKGFVKDLEKAYEAMFELYRQGKKPQQINIR